MKASTPTVRPAVAEDSEAMWKIRNQKDVRAVSNNPEPIPWEQHREWFTRYRTKPENNAFVIVYNNTVVGYCRIDAGLVSIALDKSVRGKGLGKLLLTESVEKIPGPIKAYIRCGNEASLSLFLKAGFTKDGEDPEGYHLTRHANPTRT
jgi:L-amino acid N-acyltransferase YncA